MNLCTTGSRQYIDYTCPHPGCGYHVAVPNTADIYICPNCEGLVAVIPQRAAIKAASYDRDPV